MTLNAAQLCHRLGRLEHVFVRAEQPQPERACAGKERIAVREEEVLRVFRVMEYAAKSAEEHVVIDAEI